VAVEVLASSVIDGGRAWVGVPGGDLDVTQGHPSIERRHDERCSEHVLCVEEEHTELGPV
jgi:hypothetical protein